MTLSRNLLRDVHSLVKNMLGQSSWQGPDGFTYFDAEVEQNILQKRPINLNIPYAKWWEHHAGQTLCLSEKKYLLVKRGIDLGLILATAPMVLLVIGICALILKIESPQANVFFLQKRTGKDGERFKMYKFRTMVTNAEQLKQDYMHLNELELPDFKITNDPRITKMGRFLRKTSLDELPQVANIWKGEMSWVGPRPTSFAVDTYALWHTARLEVTPGLTGLWQVVGRTEMEFDDRVRLDYEYIKNRSLWLDFKILMLTVTAAFNGK